jgi:hypothetical protein
VIFVAKAKKSTDTYSRSHLWFALVDWAATGTVRTPQVAWIIQEGIWYYIIAQDRGVLSVQEEMSYGSDEGDCEKKSLCNTPSYSSFFLP